MVDLQKYSSHFVCSKIVNVFVLNFEVIFCNVVHFNFSITQLLL